ncbi:MAG: VWA domain-containing protein [Syntrophomonadaceae bacterium]|nr:VWA domain-containing protein [Syntrophomonadaceae bacterium]MDD3889072.1 VWA domain-containing protein [Syntrophomonadaceae bacterium]MDD4549088.1 VWA domain-containing protein [Syntrophomonadaceae bacterium]
MFTRLFYTLKDFGVPVSMNEWQTLLQALEKGMAGSSLTSFYYLCRAILVKTEAHYDRFDLAFAGFFGDVETPEGLPDKIWEWLNKELPEIEITEEMRRNHQQLDLDELKRMLEERLAEQMEEHHGGNRWIGTGGTSPFGHSGYHPGGIRIGGQSRNLSAVKVAGMRRFQEFRTDETLGVRQFQMALRKLRQFTTRLEGARTELDLDATINKTCDNAGRLELVWERPRENGIKVLLLMDSGGSMVTYSQLCNQLFTAVNRASNFKDLQIFYFHNCIYDWLYHDSSCSRNDYTDTEYILRTYDTDYRLIIVGDASMAAYELMRQGGVIDWGLYNDKPGIDWLQRLRRHFEYSVWLNPISQDYWEWMDGAFTIRKIAEVFPMEELTIEGLERAIKKLKSRQAIVNI